MHPLTRSRDRKRFFGAGPWTPAQLGSALAMWLDAADSSTITLNGSTVSQWSDKSGNSRHVNQPVASAQPAYQSTALNGKPAVVFDGIDDVMNGTATQTGFFISILSPGLKSYGASLGFVLKHGLIRNALTNNLFFSVASMFLSSSARRNGTLSTVLGPETEPAIFSQGGTALNNALQLGDDDAGGAFTNCKISEVVLLSSNPVDADRQKLEGYLAWKWGGI